MAADGDAVVCRVNDVGVVELTHGFELLQHTADLDVDVFIAGELAADLVADGGFITIPPHAADFNFITHVRIAVVEGMRGQVVRRQGRLLGIQRRQRVGIFVVGCAVFRQPLGRPSRVSCGWEKPKLMRKGSVSFFASRSFR